MEPSLATIFFCFSAFKPLGPSYDITCFFVAIKFQFVEFFLIPRQHQKDGVFCVRSWAHLFSNRKNSSAFISMAMPCLSTAATKSWKLYKFFISHGTFYGSVKWVCHHESMPLFQVTHDDGLHLGWGNAKEHKTMSNFYSVLYNYPPILWLMSDPGIAGWIKTWMYVLAISSSLRSRIPSCQLDTAWDPHLLSQCDPSKSCTWTRQSFFVQLFQLDCWQ